MLSFKELLHEDIDIVDGKLIFDSDTGIKSKFGKSKDYTPYKKKVEGTDIITYSLYSASANNSTDIMRAVKRANFSRPEVVQFLKRSAVYAARLLKGMKIDTIVTPISSSNLTKEFVKELQVRTHYDVYIDSFQKNPNISSIELDADNPNITPAIIKSMQKILDKAKRDGQLSLTKFSVIHRKFLKNLFQATDKKLLAKFDGKNILIIDDIMTSGTTTKNIVDILMVNGAKEVSGLTIFKSSK